MAGRALPEPEEVGGDLPVELIRLGDLNSVQRLDLERKCASLHRGGCDFLDIGQQLHISATDARKLINRWLAKENVLEEPFKQRQRNLELSRLEALQKVYWGHAIGEEYRIVTSITGEEVAVKTPSLEAAKFIRDLGKDRRELLGLNAPKEVKADVTTHSAIDDQLAQLMAKSNETTNFRTVEGAVSRSEVSSPLEIAGETKPDPSTGGLE